MHVLQLLPRLEVGGVERGVVDLAAHLVANGHRVSVISAGGPLVERLRQLGAAHHELPVDEKSPLTIARCIPVVERLIVSEKVDLVHARSRVPAWIGWAAARRAKRPFLTTAHGFYAPHPASRVMTWGRVVIVPSQVLGAYLVHRFGMPRVKLRIIPRGVNVDEFAFAPPPAVHEGPWRIGLIGRLRPGKGHETALRACQQLLQRGVPVRLCFVGDAPGGAFRASLEASIARWGLERVVEWLGVRRDIPACLASMDVIIVPSTYPESFGRSVIEAHAVGRPVVASRLGALAEVVEDGVNGVLAEPGDPSSLAQGIERLITDDALRRRCVEAGRERVATRWNATRMAHDTLRAYEDCVTRPRIVVWKLSALGDVILAVPSLRAVRRRFPEAHLGVVTNRAMHEVLASCPYVNEVLLYDPSGRDRGLRRMLAFLARLRQEAFDWSLDLQNSRRTHWLAWLAGIPVRIGYDRKSAGVLTRAVRLPNVVLTPLAHQFHLLRQAGFSPEEDRLELWPSPRDERSAEQLLGDPPPGPRSRLVGLHPGGSARWKTKRWPLGRWIQLCEALHARQYQLVVVGGPDEHELASAMIQALRAPVRMVIGRTSVMELACVIQRCGAFVAHDSASLHVAAAVGTPTVALFGPTDPRRHLPPQFSGRVLRRPVWCSPCYSRWCRTITHACLEEISVNEVVRAVLELIEPTPDDRDLPLPNGTEEDSSRPA